MNNELGENLKSLRKRKQLSQSDLAKRLNISRQAISSWETGRNTPDIAMLSQLAKLYGLPVDQLISTKGQQKKESFKQRRIILVIIFAILFVERFTQDVPINARLWMDGLIIFIASLFTILEIMSKVKPYSNLSVITYNIGLLLFGLVILWAGFINLFHMGFALQSISGICGLIALISLLISIITNLKSKKSSLSN